VIQRILIVPINEFTFDLISTNLVVKIPAQLFIIATAYFGIYRILREIQVHLDLRNILFDHAI